MVSRITPDRSRESAWATLLFDNLKPEPAKSYISVFAGILMRASISAAAQ
jgi:hypothetical protein